jgi:hypothetical protein
MRPRPRILEGMSAGVGVWRAWQLADPRFFVERCFRLLLLPRYWGPAGLVAPGAVRRAGWRCQREPYCGANGPGGRGLGWRVTGDAGRWFGWCDWRCRRRRVPRSGPALPSRVRSRRRRDWPGDRETCGSGSRRRVDESLGREMGMRERERKRDTVSKREKRELSSSAAALALLRCAAWAPWGCWGLGMPSRGRDHCEWSACLTPPLFRAQ